MGFGRSSEGLPILVTDVIEHARQDQINRFHHSLGMLGDSISGGRDVVSNAVQFKAVVDPNQTAEQHHWKDHTCKLQR